MINILLNGCGGKMGSMISQTVKNFPDLNIAVGVDKNSLTRDYKTFNSIQEVTVKVDVILDFSRPDSLDDLLYYSKDKNIPLVLCTTGYTKEQLSIIDKASKQQAIFRSANMSLGINLINNLLKKVSPILYKDFDIEIIEKHHNQKVDAPSGTALLLANSIKDSIPETTEFVYGREGIAKRKPLDIGIHAVRGGSIVGDHEVIFAGQGEIIELNHYAMSREVFAVGALKACQFISGKTAGLYSMDNIIESSMHI
jgi:4-hydroxy-tetrahydrodipicolinate reductase